MTYLPSIPSGADIPSMSQSQIQTNFQQLENVFGADHYAWDYATTLLRGLHQQVTLPQLAAAPATTSTQLAVYTKSDGTSPQLFVRRKSSGTEIQMTAAQNPVVANPGYTFLPGGLLVQWGNLSIVGSSTSTITFPTAFSASPYSVTITQERADTSS